MKIIPIKIPNKLASVPCFVDDEDYRNVSIFKWHAVKTDKPNIFYARGWIGKKTIVLMHRFILGISSESVIDHQNHNGLDNRRGNIRVCTRSQNNANTDKHEHNSSGFKGVSRSGRKKNKWRACISVNGKTVFLGNFVSKEAAADAHVKAASKYFGRFAFQN